MIMQDYLPMNKRIYNNAFEMLWNKWLYFVDMQRETKKIQIAHAVLCFVCVFIVVPFALFAIFYQP